MKKLTIAMVAILVGFLLSCQTAQVKTDKPNMPSNAYLDGGTSTVGVILCHGRNQQPTGGVVDPLRRGIHAQLGYHTLSLQMPAVGSERPPYNKFFPEAYKRIDDAVQFLRNEKRVRTMYLMGHSLGSRMATGYLAEHNEASISGFIGVGVRIGGDVPVNSLMNLKIAMQKSPVLKVVDVYGDGGDGIDAKQARRRSFLVGDRYQQILIPGADHRFDSGEKQMVEAVVNWLKAQK